MRTIIIMAIIILTTFTAKSGLSQSNFSILKNIQPSKVELFTENDYKGVYFKIYKNENFSVEPKIVIQAFKIVGNLQVLETGSFKYLAKSSNDG